MNNFFKSVMKSSKFSKMKILNIIGFSIGFTAFLIITQYLLFEFSFDRYYSNYPDVYRIRYDKYESGNHVLKSAKTPDALAIEIKDELPEIKEVVRLFWEETSIRYNETKFTNQKSFWVDPSFFNVFNIKIVAGNAKNSLSEPNTVAISETKAKVFFKGENPVGKTIYINENMPFVVTAVFKDVPLNSHIKYDFLLSFSTAINYNWAKARGQWYQDWAHTYVLLKPKTSLPSVQSKFEYIIEKNMGFLKENNQTAKFTLQPVTSLHYEQNLNGVTEPAIDKRNLIGLIIIGLVMVSFSLINFISLYNSSIVEKSINISIKKCLGASIFILFKQNMIQFIMFFLIGCSISLLLTYSLTGLYSQLLLLPFDQIFHVDLNFVAIVAIVILIATVIAGIFQYFLIRSFSPVSNVFVRNYSSKGNMSLKKALTGFQLALALFIFGCMYIYSRQINYMNKIDIGMELNNTYAIKLPQSLHNDPSRKNRVLKFKNYLINNPDIENASISQTIPGEASSYKVENIRLFNGEDYPVMEWTVHSVSEEYTRVYNINLIAGREFDKYRLNDKNCVLVNKKGAVALVGENYNNIIGQSIYFEGRPREVIGVIEDFNHVKLNQEIPPIIFNYIEIPHAFGYFSFKTKINNNAIISQIGNEWNSNFPNDEFFWLDVNTLYEKQYESEFRIKNLTVLLTLITMVISLMGLYAYTIIAMRQRIKETGMRKLFGANQLQLFYVSSKEFFALLIIIGMVVYPFIYLSMRSVLVNYRYRIELSVTDIIIPFLLFAILTGVVFTIKIIVAAKVNLIELVRN